jgi:hypothetical protein
MMQGISTADNTKKHWRNLVRADAEQVANHIATDEDEDEDVIPMTRTRTRTVILTQGVEVICYLLFV